MATQYIVNGSVFCHSVSPSLENRQKPGPEPSVWLGTTLNLYRTEGEDQVSASTRAGIGSSWAEATLVTVKRTQRMQPRTTLC